MLKTFLLAATLVASATASSELLRAKLQNDLAPLGTGEWEEDADRLVAVTRTGDPGEACHLCHYSIRGGDGKCGGRESLDALKFGATCSNPSSCQGKRVSGHCNGGADNVCCSPASSNNGNGNGNGGGSVSLDDLKFDTQPAPAPVEDNGNYNVPPLENNGGEPGSPGASCRQGYTAGVCTTSCNTAGGYKVQRGLCGGAETCCLPGNAGASDVVLPAALENSCFPLRQNGFTSTSGDYGNGRPRSSSSRRNKRCHSGQDIFSKSPGEIVAIADGVVTGKTNCFLKCRSGWGIRQFYRGNPTCAGALYVYHESLGVTVNYGESDSVGITRPNVGARVRKGEVIGRASACGMVHVEFYRGSRSSNTRWWGSTECNNAANRGAPYSCSTPPHAAENNYCAKYAYAIKPRVNLDPRPWLLALSGKWC